MLAQYAKCKHINLSKPIGFALLSLLLLLLCIKSVQAKSIQQIQILVPNYPPYSHQKNGQWQGKAFKQAISILNKANIAYKLIPGSNFAQAFEKLKKNQVNAVLLATENNDRNNYATLTQPFFCANWNWYIDKNIQQPPTSSVFKTEYKVASPYKANSYLWLERNQYNVAGVLQVDNLAKMLQLKRIDAVLSNSAVFENAAAKANIKLSNFKVSKHSKHLVGMYIQKSYLKRQSNILKTINKTIAAQQAEPDCY